MWFKQTRKKRKIERFKKNDPYGIFAEKELSKIDLSGGIYDDYLENGLYELLAIFSSQEHSGASAKRVLYLFGRLADFKPI